MKSLKAKQNWQTKENQMQFKLSINNKVSGPYEEVVDTPKNTVNVREQKEGTKDEPGTFGAGRGVYESLAKGNVGKDHLYASTSSH